MKKIISYFLVFTLSLLSLAFNASAKASKVYRKIDGCEKKIALTFDDGPHPKITGEILEILKEYKIVATFFVIGQNAKNYPDAMKLIVESGCEIGNHTYHHENFRNMSLEEMKAEFEKCEDILKNTYSLNVTLARPPEGFCSDALYSVSDEMKYDIILWSIDTKDWAHTPAEDIVNNVLSNVKGGDIILMHDYLSGKNGTREALRVIIPKLLGEGYEFVTVSELIECEA